MVYDVLTETSSQKRLLAEKAAQKRLLASVPAAKTLRKNTLKTLREREAQLRAKHEQKMQQKLAKGLAGQKLGKHVVPEGEIEVQLGEDLTENLRTLKPEGNLFRDRFLSMQQRALIEPRVPVLCVFAMLMVEMQLTGCTGPSAKQNSKSTRNTLGKSSIANTTACGRYARRQLSICFSSQAFVMSASYIPRSSFRSFKTPPCLMRAL